MFNKFYNFCVFERIIWVSVHWSWVTSFKFNFLKFFLQRFDKLVREAYVLLAYLKYSRKSDLVFISVSLSQFYTSMKKFSSSSLNVFLKVCFICFVAIASLRPVFSLAVVHLHSFLFSWPNCFHFFLANFVVRVSSFEKLSID